MSEHSLYRHVGLGRLEMLQRGPSPFEGTHFHPPTNVYETESSIVVVVEIAGLHEGDYEISLSNGDRLLTIMGRRQPVDSETSKVTYHRLEIQYGSFVTQADLPWPIEATSEATAAYGDGFLVVTLPKARTRQVPMRVVVP